MSIFSYNTVIMSTFIVFYFLSQNLLYILVFFRLLENGFGLTQHEHVECVFVTLIGEYHKSQSFFQALPFFLQTQVGMFCWLRSSQRTLMYLLNFVRSHFLVHWQDQSTRQGQVCGSPVNKRLNTTSLQMFVIFLLLGQNYFNSMFHPWDWLL